MGASAPHYVSTDVDADKVGCSVGRSIGTDTEEAPGEYDARAKMSAGLSMSPSRDKFAAKCYGPDPSLNRK